ncbi:MAG: ROK family protein [Nocardioides sp.]
MSPAEPAGRVPVDPVAPGDAFASVEPASRSPRARPGTGANQESVRRHNLGTMLRHVHRDGQITRAELTTRMGLNRSTIKALVTELESLGVAEQAKPSTPGRQGAGRPSADVRPATTGPYVLALDVGVDRVVVARTGLGGRIQQRALAPLDTTTVDVVTGNALRLIREAVAEASDLGPLVGIGISVPGLVRRTDGIVRIAPNLRWHDVPFARLIAERLPVDVPVMIGNDADLGALAEHQRGAGVGLSDLIYICGNVGVGAGVIAGGVPIAGAGGYAGEIGHLPYPLGGKECHCGNRGCWETEVSAITIARAIGWPLEQVLSLAAELDSHTVATPELSEIGSALGRGLGLLVNLLNPQAIVLGGYLASLYPLVADEVAVGMRAHALSASSEHVSLFVPGLGRDSVLMGAAEIAFTALLRDPVAALNAAHQAAAEAAPRRGVTKARPDVTKHVHL